MIAIAHMIFMLPTKQMLFLCQHSCFHIIIYLDDIMGLIHSKCVSKRAGCSLCPLLVCLGLCIDFPRQVLIIHKQLNGLNRR